MPSGDLAVILCESGETPGDDGFWAHTAGLAKDGDGECVLDANKNKGIPKTVTMNNLLNLGVVESFHHHETINQSIVLRNKTFDEKNQKCWGRKVLLVIPKQVMNEKL